MTMPLDTGAPEVPSAESSFAPAARASKERLEAQIAALAGHPLLRALLDAADVVVVVLNRERQILVGNSALLGALGLDDVAVVEGLRLGEAFGCINACRLSTGCGTAPECATCGAVLAMLESQRSPRPVERECQITVRQGSVMGALELRVRASRLCLDEEVFTVVGIRDVSAEKRRDALERIFLHDMANTLGPLVTWAEILASQGAGGIPAKIRLLAKRLQRDIEDQRLLLQAERGTLEVARATIRPQAALGAAALVLDGHSLTSERKLCVRPDDLPAIVTDESLLVRVLVNMMKNALEATPAGGEVRAWAERSRGGCRLCVWNAGGMARDIALQVFRRSFSTKPGNGRGVGTFSMKLFGERYLGGEVGFTSTEADGTTFFIHIPGSPPDGHR